MLSHKFVIFAGEILPKVGLLQKQTTGIIVFCCDVCRNSLYTRKRRIVANCTGLLNLTGFPVRGFESHRFRNNRKVLIDPSNMPKWVDGAC